MNVYWMRQEEDLKNLKYCLENFKPIKFCVRSAYSKENKIIPINENLEGKKFSFSGDIIFKIDGKEIFNFEREKTKGFDVRYDLGNLVDGEFEEISKLVHCQYKKSEFIEIYFSGKIPLIETKFEIAEGIPFYTIRKS